MIKETVYLDYAAATPVDGRVNAAMEPYFADSFYNPAATYGPARLVKADVLTAQARIANCMGARANEIVFTSGGTEGNNLALHGVMTQFPDAKVLVSAIEHDSVIEPAKSYDHDFIAVNEQGIVDLGALERQLSDEIVLVSVMQASNEIGTIQPIRKVSLLIEAVRKDRSKRGIKLPLYLHTDACQAAGYLDIHVHRLGVDMLTINSGKLYGPKGTGALFVRSGLSLKPQIKGGGQQQGLRSGTENAAGAVGLATALEIAQAMRSDETARLGELQRYFMGELERKVPNLTINGSKKHRLPNNVHITISDQDNERLLMALDQRGIYAAAGSACSASSELPSHVLTAIGLSDEAARSSLRFSMGRQTTKTEIEHTVSALITLLA
jgi:cysteine desulfurase